MPSTTNFKASIIIGGEIGSSFRKALRGTAKETNVVGEEFRRLQRIAAQTDKAIGYKQGRTRISPKAYASLIDELKKSGVNTNDLTGEQAKYKAQLDKVEAQLKRVGDAKKSVAKVGAAWASMTKSIKTASIALGVFTAAGYGIYRFTRSMVDFNGSARVFRNFDYTIMRLKYNIAYALMPAVADALGRLGQFFNENREEIVGLFKEIGETVKQLTPFFIGLLKVGLALGRALAFISRITPGWMKFTGIMIGAGVAIAAITYKAYLLTTALMGSRAALFALMRGGTVFTVLRSLIVRVAIPAIGMLGTAIGMLGTAIGMLGTAFAWLGGVIAATPIGWIIAIGAAIVGVSYLVYKYWTPIKAFFKKLFTDPKAAVMDIWNALKRMFDWLGNQSKLGLLTKALAVANPVLGMALGATLGSNGVDAENNQTAPKEKSRIGKLFDFTRPLGSEKNKPFRISKPASSEKQPRAEIKQPRAAIKQSPAQPVFSQPVTINIHAAPGQSAEQIAQAVMKKLGRQAEQLARLSMGTSNAFA